MKIIIFFKVLEIPLHDVILKTGKSYICMAESSLENP